MNYSCFKIAIQEKIAHVSINRPEKANALHQQAWIEMKSIFESLSIDKEVRVIILSGEGRLFCAGIDLALLMSVKEFEKITSVGNRSELLYSMVKELQHSVSSIELCTKPVLAAIHSGCIGGGVDIIAACDLRYCSEDAYFTIKEIDMGMVADLGTLQRLPKFMKPAVVSEMAFTGREVKAAEAQEVGLVNARFGTKDELMEKVFNLARLIAAKSPLSVRGTKAVLRNARNHSVTEGLEFIAQWNAGKLLSDDLTESFRAAIEKRNPNYND